MSRQIIWQYGTIGTYGSGDNQLFLPFTAVPLTGGNVLISDPNNHRVIEVDRDRQIIWQYGTTGASGSGDNKLNNPHTAVPSPGGNVLIADYFNNRVIEVDK